MKNSDSVFFRKHKLDTNLANCHLKKLYSFLPTASPFEPNCLYMRYEISPQFLLYLKSPLRLHLFMRRKGNRNITSKCDSCCCMRLGYFSNRNKYSPDPPNIERFITVISNNGSPFAALYPNTFSIYVLPCFICLFVCLFILRSCSLASATDRERLIEARTHCVMYISTMIQYDGWPRTTNTNTKSM